MLQEKKKFENESNKILIEKNITSEKSKKDRRLGSEWSSWSGNKNDWNVDCSKNIFLFFAFLVLILINIFIFGLYYLIAPRLLEIHIYLPEIIFGISIAIVTYITFWYIMLLITSYTKIKLPLLIRKNRLLLGFLLDKVFQIGQMVKYNRDKLGNSFIKVSNCFAKSVKNPGEKEKLLILLPRCLTKNTYKMIRTIVKEFKIEMSICTGGEAARKKLKEYKPTAVIGIACERDLVSGIKDVGGKLSVLGIPNIRPDGPCKNTVINFNDFRKSIDFYLSGIKTN